MTTGKTIGLTRWTFVGKVMSLLFNMLFRLVITFLPRGKCLLISWLQSPSAVILEPKKIKSATVSTVPPSISHEVMRPNAMIFVFWMLSFFFFFFFKKYLFIYIFFLFLYFSCVPHPEPSSLLPPHTIPLGCPSAPSQLFHSPLSLSSRGSLVPLHFLP